MADKKAIERRKGDRAPRAKPSDGRAKSQGGRTERPGSTRRPAAWMSAAAQERAQTLQFGRRNQVLFAAGLGSILIGFGVLATGDITLAPILILAGYLVLVPWALIARSGPSKTGPGEPPATDSSR